MKNNVWKNIYVSNIGEKAILSQMNLKKHCRLVTALLTHQIPTRMCMRAHASIELLK